MAKIELTLVLPGLAPVLAQKINAGIIPKYLSTIISKASFKENNTGLSRLLFNHFSHVPLTDSDLPVRFLESGCNNSLRADPCYVHADRDRLLLFTDNLDLSDEESAELIDEIQPLFEAFNGQLSQLNSDSWVLNLDSMPELNFSALREVSKKGIENALPKGEKQQDWIRLWNEVQMTLYTSELNQRRIDENKLPINSIWFWGAGRFDLKLNAWTKVQGQSALLEQLAEKSQSPFVSTADYSVTNLSSGNILWLSDEFDLEADWLSQLERFDEAVLKPLWYRCRKAGINKIEIQIPDYGSYKLTAIDCWKFWK